jgi:ABC-type dipeptide/oligopeptide/nickel transport system permease component
MMGLQFGFLLGGSIIVERSSTGRGWAPAVDAVDMRDYP